MERREKILEMLIKSEKSIKGIDLSEKLQVSRQVIVQDIAILRASGENILATLQGYSIPKTYEKDKVQKAIACVHEGYDEIEDELKTIIDLGGSVIDVLVDHPVYGEIKSQLQIYSRYDIDQFVEGLKSTKAEPLSLLTGGIHIHRIEADDEQTIKRIKEALLKKRYLIKEG